MKRTTLYVIGGAVIIAVAVGALVWRFRPAAQPEEDLRSTVVERGTLLVAVSASGTVEPQERVGIPFEIPGLVAEVPVEVGDGIEAGDVLARLDGERLVLQVEQAQAALASAEAQLAQLRAGARPEEVAAAEAELRAVEAQLSGAVATRDQLEAGSTDAQIADAEAQLASAEFQQKVAEKTFDRIDKKDKERKEQAQLDLYAANEAVAAAQALLDEVLAGADNDEIRAARANLSAAAAQRDAAQAQLGLLRAGPTAGQIAAAEARVAQAQVALEQAERSLDQATLQAPFDGIVAAVDVAVGERVSPGVPAITVVDTSRFRVTVSVDELDVGRLAVGEAAEVTLEALPDVVIDGTVERIAPAATIDGGVVNYRVAIGLVPTDESIRTDMTANATVVVEELADVLTIPTWVVRVDRATGETYVDRQAGDEPEQVDVRLGVRHEGQVQVLDGLAEGDVVVLLPDEPGPFGGQ